MTGSGITTDLGSERTLADGTEPKTGRDLDGAIPADASTSGNTPAQPHHVGRKDFQKLLDKHAKYMSTGSAADRMVITDSVIEGVQATELNMSGAVFKGSRFKFCTFWKSNFDEGVFDGAVMRGTVFENSSFRDAKLRGVLLRGASFRGADLTGADFTTSGSGSTAKASELNNTQLQGAKLNKAKLSGADLGNADMSGGGAQPRGHAAL